MRLSKTRLFHATIAITYYGILYLAYKKFKRYKGTYSYKCIHRDEIPEKLVTAVNPVLSFDPSLPACDYNVINSKIRWLPKDVLSRTHQFSNAGIINGSYYPANCRPLFSIAILVTYRNRSEQLKIFIPYMHNFLRKQNIHYKIYILEQQDTRLMNRGMLYNLGAKFAIAENFPCLVLHDVDLFPLDEANLYACLTSPRHMSASIDIFKYALPYKEIMGGVAAVQVNHYLQVNGFSNKYFGWGGEDDDFALRLEDEELKVLRFPRDMSRYMMLTHPQEDKSMLRKVLVEQSQHTYREDGYSTLPPHSAELLHTHLYALLAVHIYDD